MQQTQKYKLNLIESSDPFLPDGLNRNTQKIEDVLAAREAANDQKLAGMEGRVAALEAHKFYMGTYTGDGATQRFIDLGFTPLAVGVSPAQSNFPTVWAFSGCQGDSALAVTQGGFQAGTGMAGTLNSQDHVYMFLVFV